MRKVLFLLFIILTLQACTNPITRPSDSPQWQQHAARLKQIQQWNLNASIAAHSEDDGFNARLFWKQQAENYELRISGPLGQGAAVINGGENWVRMRTGDNQVYEATSPDSLLEQATGFKLPLSYLHYWVRGLPAANVAEKKREIDEQGRLVLLQQGEWEIEYARYKSQQNIQLPSKLYLRHENYFAKIVISKWQL